MTIFTVKQGKVYKVFSPGPVRITTYDLNGEIIELLNEPTSGIYSFYAVNDMVYSSNASITLKEIGESNNNCPPSPCPPKPIPCPVVPNLPASHPHYGLHYCPPSPPPCPPKPSPDCKNNFVYIPYIDQDKNLQFYKSVVTAESANFIPSTPVNLVGPQGEQGEQGLEGPAGPKGDTGEQGPQGITFTPVYSQETGDLSWTNNGDLDNPNPVHIKGEDGKSAYELWLAEGNTGTLQDFFAEMTLGVTTQRVNIPSSTEIEYATINSAVISPANIPSGYLTKIEIEGKNSDIATLALAYEGQRPVYLIVTDINDNVIDKSIDSIIFDENNNNSWTFNNGIKLPNSEKLKIYPSYDKDGLEPATIKVSYIQNGDQNSEIQFIEGSSLPGVAVITTFVTTTIDVSMLKGPEGPEGPQGPKGETGPQGPQGPQGEQGKSNFDIWLEQPENEGKSEADFIAEFKGIPGAVYTPSVDQNSGELSWTNNGGLDNPEPVNIKGPAGPKGDQGIQGPTGPKGDTGATGLSGVNGVTYVPNVSAEGQLTWTKQEGDPMVNPAAVNIKGPQGETGPQGAQGLQGPRGERGVTSVTANIIEPTGDTTPVYNINDGSLALNIPKGVTFTPTVSDEGNLSWTNDGGLGNPDSVNIKGSKGEQGQSVTSVTANIVTPTGDTTPVYNINDGSLALNIPKGVTFTPNVSDEGLLSWTNDGGVQVPNPASINIKGPQGIQGEPGEQGPRGVTFTPNYNQETGDLSWTNDGGLSNPDSVNIKGPKGEQGIQGPAGPAGANGQSVTSVTVQTGNPGTDATANYDQSNGALSLTIPRGDKGETGLQGPQGNPGNPGQSITVVNVATGNPGTNATADYNQSNGILNLTIPRGDTGEAGPTGPQGNQGPTGPQGPTGETGPQGPQGDSGIERVEARSIFPHEEARADYQASEKLLILEIPKGENGRSAYDIWLQEGNSGSESEFIASLKGEQGEPGAPGTNGQNGEPGTDGVTYVPNVSAEGELTWTKQSGDVTVDIEQVNIKGPQGNPGPTGPQGEAGPKGADGQSITTVNVETGAPGSTAIVNYTQSTGVLNLTIPRGDKGETGEQGPQGNPGPKGDTGETGPTGPQGPKGNTGETGPAGAPGQSVTSVTADIVDPGSDTTPIYDENTGALTLKVPQGPRGEQGEPGTNGQNGEPGINGATYVPNVSSEGILTWTKQTGDVTVDIEQANIKGPQGLQGPAGPKGTDGQSITTVNIETGTPGSEAIANYTQSTGVLNLTIPRGDVGPQGPKGDSGISTVSAVAGDEANAVYNPDDRTIVFTLPRGEQGPQGNPGPKGDTGNQGPAGVNGQSVTSVTVQTGEPGTEATANYDQSNGALSLTIPRGATGETGPQGEQGIQGPTGAQGPSGVNSVIANTGNPGTEATANYDASTSTITLTIPRGDKGEQGIQGPVGPSGVNNVTAVAGDEANAVYNPDDRSIAFTLPQGPQGNPGPKGESGVNGVTYVPNVSSEGQLTWTKQEGDPQVDPAAVNIKGPQGETGPAGVNGQSVTSVTVQTGEPGTEATADYNQSNGILNLTIPRGDTGEAGPAGPQGPSGVDNVTAVAGEEANAVYNSDNRTIAFTLPRGPQGIQGETGPQGPAGETGSQGEQGVTFTPNTNQETGVISWTNNGSLDNPADLNVRAIVEDETTVDLLAPEELIPSGELDRANHNGFSAGPKYNLGLPLISITLVKASGSAGSSHSPYLDVYEVESDNRTLTFKGRSTNRMPSMDTIPADTEMIFNFENISLTSGKKIFCAATQSDTPGNITSLGDISGKVAVIRSKTTTNNTVFEDGVTEAYSGNNPQNWVPIFQFKYKATYGELINNTNVALNSTNENLTNHINDNVKHLNEDEHTQLTTIQSFITGEIITSESGDTGTTTSINRINFKTDENRKVLDIKINRASPTITTYGFVDTSSTNTYIKYGALDLQSADFINIKSNTLILSDAPSSSDSRNSLPCIIYKSNLTSEQKNTTVYIGFGIPKDQYGLFIGDSSYNLYLRGASATLNGSNIITEGNIGTSVHTLTSTDNNYSLTLVHENNDFTSSTDSDTVLYITRNGESQPDPVLYIDSTGEVNIGNPTGDHFSPTDILQLTNNAKRNLYVTTADQMSITQKSLTIRESEGSVTDYKIALTTYNDANSQNIQNNLDFITLEDTENNNGLIADIKFTLQDSSSTSPYQVSIKDLYNNASNSSEIYVLDVINAATSASTPLVMEPGKLYDFGLLATAAYDLSSISLPAQAGKWITTELAFQTPSTGTPNITWPSGLLWVDMPSQTQPPTINANYCYRFSIRTESNGKTLISLNYAYPAS